MAHYRKITVDGQEYEWVVGTDIVKVKGVGVIRRDILVAPTEIDEDNPDIFYETFIKPADIEKYIREQKGLKP